MRIWLIIISLATISSCGKPEPTLYSGTANVFASDGVISDTLRICYCWQSKDSLNLHITRGPFMGIAIDVTGKNNFYSTSLEYYSDTNEFDSEFDLDVPIREDSLTISYQAIGDSIRLSGYFDIKSEEVKFYKDGRTIETSGTFNCTFRTTHNSKGNMSSNSDHFLFLSSTGWTAVASIAAVLAIVIALFLPYYQRRRSLNNLRKVIMSELQVNITLLNKASSLTEGEIEGRPISKMNLMCPILITINLSDWNNYRVSIAEKSSERYLDLRNINNRLHDIKEHATQIIEMKGESPYVALIENEIDTCLKETSKTFPSMNYIN